MHKEGCLGQHFLDGCESFCGIFTSFNVLGVALGVRKELVEWLQDPKAAWEKMVIEVHQSKELPELALGSRLGEVADDLHRVF